MSVIIVQNGVNREVKKITVGVSGVNREIKTAWAGNSGVNRKVFAVEQHMGDLPIGSLVKDTGTRYNGVPVVWRIVDRNHSGYPENSVTLITDKIISLKCFDAREPSNDDSDQKLNGNNRYSYSNICRWLNSDGWPGGWYSAQHWQDAPPTKENVGGNAYAQEAGFLYGFSASMRDALLATTLTVAKNTVTDGGGSETVTDKIFLASTTEAGLGNKNEIVEGAPLAAFTSDASRSAYLTPEAVANDDGDGGGPGGVVKSWYYWLRTPSATSSDNVLSVGGPGTLYFEYMAYIGWFGVRPLCNLSSEILVSDTTDSDGAHIMQF